MSRKTRSRPSVSSTWTSPDAAAREIFTDLTSGALTEPAAERLGHRLAEEVFPGLEPYDAVDVASRLAVLPNASEVAAAVTLLLRVAPLSQLCRIWREAIEAASECVQIMDAEFHPVPTQPEPAQDATVQGMWWAPDGPDPVRTTEAATALREAAEQDAPALQAEWDQACREAEAQDAAAACLPPEEYRRLITGKEDA